MMETHVPSVEFRAKLEDDVVRAFRRASQFDDRPPAYGTRRARGLLILLAGIALGSGTQFLAAQAQNAQERNRLIEVASENRRIEIARASLAEEAYRRAKTAFETGVVNRESLISAETDLRRIRQRIERLDLEIAEIRATGAPPRDELWAPPIGGRDFVSERLKSDSALGAEGLSRAEERLRDAERLVRLGLAEPSISGAAEAAALEARQDVALTARKLELRRRFLEERLGADAIARELKRFEMETEIARTAARLRRAEDRAARARSAAASGVASEIDARRAELEVLEQSALLKRLRAALGERSPVVP
jgi:hypothetical protein